MGGFVVGFVRGAFGWVGTFGSGVSLCKQFGAFGAAGFIVSGLLRGVAFSRGLLFGGAFRFIREQLREAQLQPVLRALNEEILNRHAVR